MRKFFLGIIVFNLMILSLVGCKSDVDEVVGFSGTEINEEKEKEKEKILTMAIGDEPDQGFDPIYGWGRYGSPLIQSTLVETNSKMEIVNDLASGYEISEDGMTWTFNLREDAYFTDGTKVTANDIKFTYEKTKESNSRVDLTVVDSIIAIDEFTIEFKLTYPQSAFIYNVAKIGIVPQHAYDTSYGDNPIGSGPYKFVQWDKGQQLILEANEDYYGNVPEIKHVAILFMSEDAAMVAAKSGQLDVAMTVPSMANIEIDGMTLYNAKTVDNRGITLSVVPSEGEITKEGYPIGNDVTSDVSIRRALSYGLSREQMVEEVLNGYGVPAYSECDDMPWSNDASIVEYDIEKAKSILEEAGWIDIDNDGIREKGNLKAEFTIIYSAGDSIRQGLALFASEQAKQLGISIQVEGLSWDEIDKRMFRDAVLMGWGDQTPMETYMLYNSKNKGIDYYNPENYSNETVDKYMDEALATTDTDAANKLWKKAKWDGTTGTSTLGDSPWVWLVNIDHLYYVRDGLDVGEQKIHPHGHAWPFIANLREWKWTK